MDPAECEGFDWDGGNRQKNWVKHAVMPFECEQLFFNQPLIVAPDEAHSDKETRFYALGRTDGGRLLFAAFTIRKKLIRVISARDMSRFEKEVYNSHEK
jgi:uncharacterized DUF497 family protein